MPVPSAFEKEHAARVYIAEARACEPGDGLLDVVAARGARDEVADALALEAISVSLPTDEADGGRGTDYLRGRTVLELGAGTGAPSSATSLVSRSRSRRVCRDGQRRSAMDSQREELSDWRTHMIKHSAGSTNDSV